MAAALVGIFCLSVALGALTGVFKRCSKFAPGGLIVLFTLIIERISGGAMSAESSSFGIVMLIVSIVSLAIFIGVFNVLNALLAKAVKERRTMSHYRNKDTIEELEYYVMDALDKNDKKAYKKARKQLKKVKDKAGVWGVLDCVFGGVSGAINAAVIATCVICGIVMFADISGIGALQNLFEASINSGAWVNFGAKIALDLSVTGIIYLVIMAGYNGGITSALCFILVLGMVALFAWGAFSIADASGIEVEGISGGIPLPGSLGSILGKVIVAAILFILSMVVVVLVAIFLPKLVEKFRENKTFKRVDGAIGAIVCGIMVLAILLVFGGIAYSLWDFNFMQTFTAYEKNAYFAGAMYHASPLAGTFESFPLRTFLGK